MDNLRDIILNSNVNHILTGGIIGIFLILLTVLIIWSLIWKGIALWKSARNHHKVWFIIFLIINTLGILEIIYIFLISKKSKKETPTIIHNN